MLILLPNPASNVAYLQRGPAFLYVSRSSTLDEKQRRQIEQIRAGHADLDTAYHLTQTFVTMLAEHRETGLDDWLTQAEHCGIKELKSFAASASVAIMLPCAPPSLPTGATDRWKRRLNCLKLQKRLMFGRANFDLLRLHVLRRM